VNLRFISSTANSISFYILHHFVSIRNILIASFHEHLCPNFFDVCKQTLIYGVYGKQERAEELYPIDNLSTRRSKYSISEDTFFCRSSDLFERNTNKTSDFCRRWIMSYSLDGWGLRHSIFPSVPVSIS
jgi:hypothetical protein